MPNSKLKCKHCKQYKPREVIIRINSGNFCGESCVLAFALKNKHKGRKIIENKAKKEHRERLKAVKPLSHWEDLTQTAFNKMRVLEERLWFQQAGLESECISCGKNNMDWCCGHFKSRGASSELRYDRMNTHLQCNYYCNRNLSGNIHGTKTTRGYIEGLKQRFGEDEAQEIIDYCESDKQVKRWTMEELKEMRSEYYERIRLLESILE